MTPGSCSTGIHILLEEADELFEVYLVNLMQGQQYQSDYLALNPKGTIPTLVNSAGNVFTDFLSIAWWLGKQYPRQGWIPQESCEQARMLEVLSYAVNTLHGQGFTRIFTPEKYQFDQLETSTVEAQGRALVTAGFNWVNRSLQGEHYVCDQFSLADVAVFYCEFWAKKIDLPLPQRCESHLRTMLQRPKVQAVLIEEGYGRWLQQELSRAVA